MNYMIELKPTNKITEEQLEEAGITIFLAGSIDMGLTIDWQSAVVERFKDKKVTFFNPRRDEWDLSWKQIQSATNFNEQVNWEMNNLEDCDIIFMHFEEKSKAPISLLELGLNAASGKMIVVCPDGFWRKGNVEIVCTRYNIPLFNTLEDGMGALETFVRRLER
jgi:hypothetical protein